MAAYAIFFIAFVIVVSGLLYVTLSPVYNEFIKVMNPFISDGDVSKQFVTYWNFVRGLWSIFLILVVIALIIWAVVRAIERRQEGGM